MRGAPGARQGTRCARGGGPRLGEPAKSACCGPGRWRINQEIRTWVFNSKK
jgi:hypothetical protein